MLIEDSTYGSLPFGAFFVIVSAGIYLAVLVMGRMSTQRYRYVMVSLSFMAMVAGEGGGRARAEESESGCGRCGADRPVLLLSASAGRGPRWEARLC